MSKSPPQTLSGVLLIDKPGSRNSIASRSDAHRPAEAGRIEFSLPGPTSHDIVNKIRRLLTTHYPLPTKVGHTGTLDPFATGLLLVVLGSATRLIEYAHDWDKEYEATITLGATSDTDDITGTIDEVKRPGPPPDKGELEGVLRTLTGPLNQIPPTHAAIKVKGKKLYEYARAGEYVERPPRAITIHRIELTDYTYPTLALHITCSTGTYIRALARDIGQALHTGAYLRQLRRTRIGPHTIDQSIKPNQLTPETLPQHLKPPQTLISHLPTATLTSANVAQFKTGRAVGEWKDPKGTEEPHSIAVYDTNHTLIGIGRITEDPPLLHPQKVL